MNQAKIVIHDMVFTECRESISSVAHRSVFLRCYEALWSRTDRNIWAVAAIPVLNTAIAGARKSGEVPK